jgi:ABC-type phosphate transport system auxiliary subunit|tara:strand:- start:2732 stop:2893 length:162 start_codon:yes stop_codon:yes gene_type:complete
MAELTINQLIKIIIGIFVVVVVVGGLYLFFSNYVVDFFKNIPGNSPKLIISLI